MAKQDTRDALDVAGRPATAADRQGKPRPALPTAAEPMSSPAQSRESLIASIAELEGTLRFMGGVHPKRDETEERLAELKRLLEQLERSR